MISPTPPVPMPMERRTTLFLNGSELLTIQATPLFLEDWAVGFLFSEGIIDRPGDLRSLAVDEAQAQIFAGVDPARLEGRDVAAKRYLTSGCGKGITFSSLKDAMLLRPVRHGLQLVPGQVAVWIKQMQRQTPLYAQSGGMHAAAAVHTPTGAMLVREDIGRHNALDKAIGAALQAGWPASEVVMLTTGRISYEMCAKLARFGAGAAASLTAATDQAVRLADRLGIELLGYVRKADRVTLFTAGRRIHTAETGAPAGRPSGGE